jgi:hypothetical protein
MRHVIASVLIAGSLSLPALAAQSGGGAAGQPIRVCSILTRDLAMKVSTPEGKTQIERTKPIENPVPNTTSCQVGRVMLVVDPFPKPEYTRKNLGKQWQPVSGIGDAAFYWGTNQFGNLYVFTTPHNFSIEITKGDEPDEVVKANAITLAKEVAPKLR